MNVARLNCSHGDWDTKAEAIEQLRGMAGAVAPVAILADLQGPKHRLEEVEGGKVTLAMGQVVEIGDGPVALPIDEPDVIEGMKAGDTVFLGDGEVSLKILEKMGRIFRAKVLTGGVAKSRQGVTVYGRSFDSVALTEKDKFDVFQACRFDVDYIALSYVRSAADLLQLRRMVQEYGSSARLVAKIETREAVADIEEIARASDAVMVARGDLGLQIPIEDVPLAQKRIIHVANRLGKPVITATQMLESMIVNARPTRAEATDVANAVLDGTDAVMLSGETATGAWPVEAVKTMDRIALKAEAELVRRTWDYVLPTKSDDSTEAVALAATQVAHSIGAKAIVTLSTSGATPRLVRKVRPRLPILCATWDERVQRQMSLVGGVVCFCIPNPETTDEAVGLALEAAVKNRLLKFGETVVLTAGVPPGVPGNTNLILVRTV